jgi:hypothetical protein
MAYLRDLPAPRCAACGKPAKVELVNQRNATHGAYCRPCGGRFKAELERAERAANAPARQRDDGAMRSESE